MCNTHPPALPAAILHPLYPQKQQQWLNKQQLGYPCRCENCTDQGFWAVADARIPKTLTALCSMVFFCGKGWASVHQTRGGPISLEIHRDLRWRNIGCFFTYCACIFMFPGAHLATVEREKLANRRSALRLKLKSPGCRPRPPKSRTVCPEITCFRGSAREFWPLFSGNVNPGLINPWLINRGVSPFSGDSLLWEGTPP